MLENKLTEIGQCIHGQTGSLQKARLSFLSSSNSSRYVILLFGRVTIMIYDLCF